MFGAAVMGGVTKAARNGEGNTSSITQFLDVMKGGAKRMARKSEGDTSSIAQFGEAVKGMATWKW